MSRVVNARNDSVLVNKLEKASTFSQRLIGLMGRKTLAAGEGLLIRGSGNSIHTCFMRFPIDVAFVTKQGEVKHISSDLKPWRMVIAPVWTLTDCLELPAGTLKNNDTRIGDTLRVED